MAERSNNSVALESRDGSDRQISITFGDLWQVFLGRVWICAIAAVLAVVVMFVFNTVTFEPLYDSTATLYVLKKENESTTTVTSSDFSLALDVVNDCTHLIKSHKVLDKVIENLELSYTYDDLYKSISTNNPTKTRVLLVTVQSESPELSQKIADEVCEIGCEAIEEAMGFKQTNFYEHGIYNDKPSNKVGLSKYFLVGLAAAILTYVVFVVIFILDDSIRTKEEIERYLGLTILGEIPNVQDAENGKTGYGKYGKKYYRNKGHKYGYGEKG